MLLSFLTQKNIGTERISIPIFLLEYSFSNFITEGIPNLRDFQDAAETYVGSGTCPSWGSAGSFLTANAVSGMKEKYLNSGFDDYLAKPIDKYELDRILKKYLKDKK